MVINFSSILFSIFLTENSIALILSMYTLSFSIVCDTRIHIPTLEKLITIYEDEIIPNINKYMRNYKKNNNDNDAIYDLQQIEKKFLIEYMGKSFMLSNTLRGMNCKKIISIILIYIVSFIIIAILCYYKNIGKI